MSMPLAKYEVQFETQFVEKGSATARTRWFSRPQKLGQALNFSLTTPSIVANESIQIFRASAKRSDSTGFRFHRLFRQWTIRFGAAIEDVDRAAPFVLYFSVCVTRARNLRDVLNFAGEVLGRNAR